MNERKGLQQLHLNTQEFHRRLMNQVRVLVVDDEEGIRMVLEELLQDEGYQVDQAANADDARLMFSSVHYDLLVTDKNLPGESGVELIAGLREAGIQVPSVIITGYASEATISEALGGGASDYITKPFDSLDHLVGRLKLVIHERLSALHFGFVAREFKAMLASGGIDADSKIQVGQAMIAAQRALAGRLQVTVLDDDELIGKELEAAGMTVEHLPFDKASEVDASGPLVVVIQLRGPEILELIQAVHRADPNAEIVVVGNGMMPLELSLDAIRAGAKDYVRLDKEGNEVLRHRIQQALERSRRRHRNLSLVASLCLAARDRGLENWEDTLAGLTDADRRYILEALGMEIPEDTAGQGDDVLEEVLDDLTKASDLRRARRFAFHEPVWVICSESEKLADAFMVQAEASDISMSGMFIRNMDPPLGSVVIVQLPASNGSGLTDITLARVVRRTDEGVGVHFLRSGDQVEDVIRGLGTLPGRR